MPVLKKADRLKVVSRLLAGYPAAGCALDFTTEYQLLVSVVLSAQTTDRSVNEVTPALFAAAPDAHAMAALSPGEIQEYIRRIGMYRTKADHIWNLSNMLIEKYGGEVPGTYEQLIELPGVGRKTANVVLSVAFGEQRIAVDTHVFRLANRIGLTKEPDVLKTELALMKVIPEQNWTAMHHALIHHGRQVCSARKPRCDECILLDVCARNGV